MTVNLESVPWADIERRFGGKQGLAADLVRGRRKSGR